ncbi:MAG: hypothetical protein Q7T05_05090 [Dehalococcoidia bacterium]|nr:hypothetical protein [Dehalococcoidia bacterium]
MSRKESGIMIVLALAAGLVGGAVSGRLIAGDPVTAQETSKRTKIIDAELVQATGFQVVDMNGKPRAHLGTRPDGSKTSLSIGYEEGQPRAVLSNLPDGSIALALIGPDGKSTSLSWDAGGRMGLVLLDKNRNMRGQVFLGSDGSPSFIFQDKNGKVLFKAP